MPAKHSVKVFIPGRFYHVYNRGVAKGEIFLDERDYLVFLRFLKEYLLPEDHDDLRILQGINPRRIPMNCCGMVELHTFCLMPNHFHLLIKLLTVEGMTRFMKALGTNYAMTFNQRYERVGPLFQGVYKSVMIETEAQLLHLSRYIHRNPRKLLARDQPLQGYSYSSYLNYLGMVRQDWLKTEEILGYFAAKNPRGDYERFVNEVEENGGLVADLVIEDDEG